MITSPVIVHTMIVSTKGSSRATIPSRTGSGVAAAECAIAAEPVPASLLNAARRMPWMIVPISPPAPAWSEKADWIIVLIASANGEKHVVSVVKDAVFFVLYGILLIIAIPAPAAA